MKTPPVNLADVDSRLRELANVDHQAEIGRAILATRDLYKRALLVQDFKTALAARIDLNKLLNLYRPEPKELPKL